MACGGCSKKKKISKNGTSSNKNGKIAIDGGWFISLINLILISVGLTLLTPFIWVLLMVIAYKSTYGEGFDIPMFVKNMNNKYRKNPEEEVDEEMNPDDLEMVGVDKIK